MTMCGRPVRMRVHTRRRTRYRQRAILFRRSSPSPCDRVNADPDRLRTLRMRSCASGETCEGIVY